MSAGEWLPSIVTAEMLQGYQDSGMLPRHGCRAPPPGEEEPFPQEGERVLLLSHVDRGFSLPPHPFLLDFLAFTGAQLHHIVPNAITLLASFFTLCEGFLGIEPHWHLFRNIYTIKPQKVKKSGEGGGVEFNHLCGGLFLAKRTGVQYFPSSLPDSVKNWQNSWFYCKVEEGPGVRTLPPYSDVRLTDSQGWNPRLTNAEKEQVLPLMLEIVRLKTNGLDAMDLISTFVIRRTQPLQARARGMWTYTGLRDDTRYSNAEMQTEEYEHRMRVITSVTHGLQVVGRVRPLDSLHPPTLPNIAQYHSPIPLAPRHPGEEDEDSNTGARIEVEAGDEMESNVNSPPVTSEIRSKSNQDRDSAREGLVRSRKRSLPPSSGEGSSKLPALSPSHGKVAPMKTKKNLTTLGGRKVSPSGGVAEAVKTKTAAANVVAPPRRTLRVVRNVRPSGSESLPGVEGHDPETFEDVSTCGVTDFPVMDTIPEHTSAEMNVDVDARVDNVEANPDQAAPEPTILTPTAAVDDLPASPALPEIHASTTAHKTAPASSSPISADTPIEDAIVSGLKSSLLKASQFESRLHELASEAESMRASMHKAVLQGFPRVSQGQPISSCREGRSVVIIYMDKTSASGLVQENEKVGNDSPSSPTKGKRGRKGSQIIASKKYPLRSAHSSARVLRSTSKDKSKTPNEPVSPLRSVHSSPRVLRSTPKNKSETPKKQVNPLRSAHSSARVLSSTSKKKAPNEPVNDKTAVQPAARKRKRGRPSNAASPKNECIKIRQRVRYILNRMNYEQSLIEAYAGEGWKGQSLEKIRPEKELERAKAEILRCKLRIREAFRNMDSLLLEGKLDESLFDSEGEISSEDIFCAICASKHVTPKNDIILCDGVCDRGFHQKCLNPPLLAEDIPPEDEGWLCPACDCKLDCIDLLNELQGSTLDIHDSWEKVFPESTSNGLKQIGASDLPSDDSEDDYDPILAEGEKSSAEDGDEGSDSADLDFITSSDESEPSKKKKSESKNKNTVDDLGPSEDSEDDDFDPEGPNSSEDQKTKTNSEESDFTSDSDDFCAEISKSCGKDEVLAPSFPDQTDGVDIMEAELEQDLVLPASSRRQVGRLDYKKLYDEAYGKETSDTSDEEEWSGNGNLEESDTDSLAKPAKICSRRARGGRQKNERTPQSERHCGSVSEQHPEVIHSNGNSSTARKKGFGPIVNQKLKAHIEKDPYPSRSAKESLAQELGLTFNQVTKWFASTRFYSRATSAKKEKRPENYTAENNDGIAADSIQQREPNGSVLEKPTVDRNGIVPEGRMAQTNLDEGEKEDTPLRQRISCEQTLDVTPTAKKHRITNSREVDSPIGAPGGNQRLNSPKSVGSPRGGSAEKKSPGLEQSVDEARRKAILRELRKMKAAGR